MIEMISNVFLSLQSETAGYPQPILIWMRIMALSYLASLVFVYSRPGARWILAVFVTNVVGLVLGRILFPYASRAELGASTHLLFWPILLWCAWRPNIRPSFQPEANGLFGWIYVVWLCWVSLLICISVVLDLKILVFGF